MYLAELETLLSTEDVYGEGEIGDSYDGTYSLQTTGSTPKIALEKMADNLGLERTDFEIDDYYENSVITGYLADDRGVQASKREIDLWKQGRKRLYSVYVRVGLSKVVPATPTEMKKALSKSNPSRRPTARKRRR